MTRDELLTAYEDLWRQNALEDRKQVIGYACSTRPHVTLTRGSGPFGSCAALTPYLAHGRLEVWYAAEREECSWRCACGYRTTGLRSVMIHMNNEHEWTWDMFAGKFRDALAEGEARAKP